VKAQRKRTVKCSNTRSDRSNRERQSELRRNEWQKDGNEKRDSLSIYPWSENEVHLLKPAIALEFDYDEQRVNFLFFNLNSICICSSVPKWAVGFECSKDKRNIVRSILQAVVQRNDILKQMFFFFFFFPESKEHFHHTSNDVVWFTITSLKWPFKHCMEAHYVFPHNEIIF